MLALNDLELIADVTHNLRNHLFVMGSSLNLLLSQEQPEEKTAAHLLRMQRALNQTRQLLDVLLLLSREEAAIEASPVTSVLRNIVDRRRTVLERKNLTVSIVVDADVSTHAPAAVLSAVIGNLVDEVIGEMDTGEITLVVDEKGVTILDTVVGDPARRQSCEFDESTDAQTVFGSERTSGFSIAERLCERYGWRIEVFRPEEGGKKVRITLSG